MALVYTTLASDSFHRADENPVNPAVWSAGLPSLGVHTPCQIVSDELEPVDAAGAAFYTAISWPNNQWAQVQVDACQFSDDDDYASVLLVLNGGTNSDVYYALEVDGPLGATCNVSIFEQTGSGYVFFLGTDAGDAVISLFAGDTIRMELFNGMLSAYVIHEGVSTPILAPTLGSLVQGGTPGLVLYQNTLPADAQVSNFSGGTITDLVTPTGNATPRADVSPTFPLMPQAWPLTVIPGSDPLAAEALPQSYDPNDTKQTSIVTKALSQSGNTGNRLS
jgi:hypothetical protein